MLAIAVTGALARCVFKALIREKEITDTFMNAGVCLAAVLLCAFLAFQFLNVDIINDLRVSVTDFSTVYSSSYQSGMEDPAQNLDKISAAVGNANVKNAVTVYIVCAVCVIVLSCALVYFIKQLAAEGDIERSGKHSVSRSGMVVCALVIAVGLIPSIIGTASADACNDSFERGKYKMLWDSYKYSDTAAGTDYSGYTSNLSSCENAINSLMMEITGSGGEDTEEYEEVIGYYENYREIIKLKINRSKADKKGIAGVCMASSVALLVIQFIYTFIMHDDKRKKTEEAVLVEGEVESYGDMTSELSDEEAEVSEISEDSKENQESDNENVSDACDE